MSCVESSVSFAASSFFGHRNQLPNLPFCSNSRCSVAMFEVISNYTFVDFFVLDSGSEASTTHIEVISVLNLDFFGFPIIKFAKW